MPALLLPYPHATDDHQRRNADVFTAVGGAVMLDQRDLSGRLHDDLAAALSRLLGDSDRRSCMSTAMASLARPHAAADVAALSCRRPRRPTEMCGSEDLKDRASRGLAFGEGGTKCRITPAKKRREEVEVAVNAIAGQLARATRRRAPNSLVATSRWPCPHGG